MKSRSSLLTLLSLVLITLHFANAQDLDNATIWGRVLDQNSAVIPGAVVEATLVSTSWKRNAITDSQGRYRLIQLEPGTYTIQFNASGFGSLNLTNVITVAGQSLTLDPVLTPATINAETVVISSELPVVDTRRTIVGTTMAARETHCCR